MGESSVVPRRWAVVYFVFHKAWAALTFLWAVSVVNGGTSAVAVDVISVCSFSEESTGIQH
jgi:hypothetical protein